MKAELEIRAVTVFKDLFPDNWKHKDSRGPGNRIGLYCTKCKIEYTRQNGELDKPCTIPDPVNINDWNVAHELGGACDWMLFEDALLSLYRDYCKKGVKDKTGFINYFGWFTHIVTPADFILAACRAKEGEQSK